MICPNCKKNNKPDSLFCEYCGSQLKKQKKSKKGLWITLSIIFVVITAVIAVCTISEQQQKQEQIAWKQQQAQQYQQELEHQLKSEHKAKKDDESRLKAKENPKTKEKSKAKEDNKFELVRQGYVDLGLPSGTLWHNQNEGGDNALYTYEKAKKISGGKLPTKRQFEELKNKCSWTWTDRGYKVTGPNGKTIFLPAASCLDCDRKHVIDGTIGRYWSSTTFGLDDNRMFYFYFNSSSNGMAGSSNCWSYSVRLVQ